MNWRTLEDPVIWWWSCRVRNGRRELKMVGDYTWYRADKINLAETPERIATWIDLTLNPTEP